MIKSDFDQEIPSLNRPQNMGWFVLMVRIDDIEEFYKNIKNKIKLRRELQSTDYNTKEFTIEDLDGHLIQFSQRL